MSYSSTWQSQQDIIMENKKGGFNLATITATISVYVHNLNN